MAQLGEGLTKRLSTLQEHLQASEPEATAAEQAVETAKKVETAGAVFSAGWVVGVEFVCQQWVVESSYFS